MFCPECRTEYIEGVDRCEDCDLSLVSDLPKLPEPEFQNFIKLYAPADATDLIMVKSLLDGAGIGYFVRNENFGSLYAGLQIDLFNGQTVMVREEEFDHAREIVSDYLGNTQEDPDEVDGKKYSLNDKLRMVFEFLMFGWVFKGRKK